MEDKVHKGAFSMIVTTISCLVILSGSETARLADFLIIIYSFFLAVSIIVGVDKLLKDSRR